MCDTVVVVEQDRVLFAKNSDRDGSEAQALEWRGRQTHARGARVMCTWSEIPQVEETCAILISRPFWMWGAEIGANEYGVAIGNEAVFTRQPYAKTGLTGMDLLRLALERSESAERACQVITGLLDEYGQGGGCGYENRGFTYHNSFIVADPERAFVLETAGRAWAVEEVRGARTISNGLTIRGFAERHSDFLYTRISSSRTRQARTQSLAGSCTGVSDLFALLRDHGEGCTEPRYALLTGGMAAPCMHVGGLLASSQTTASWVAELRPSGSQHWVTGTAAPCTGLFKPVRVDQAMDLHPQPTGAPDKSLWWRHERLHRAVMVNPAALMPLFATERDAVEAAWAKRPPEPRAAWAEADRLLAKWTEVVQARLTAASGVDRPGSALRDVRPFLARRYWAKRAGTCCP